MIYEMILIIYFGNVDNNLFEFFLCYKENKFKLMKFKMI